jgi:hypothetical protein
VASFAVGDRFNYLRRAAGFLAAGAAFFTSSPSVMVIMNGFCV